MKYKTKSLIKSFKYAINGIIIGLKEEKNMKIHFLFVILVTTFGIVLKITKIEWIICIILYGLVISSELINTALEATVDLITDKYDEKAKIAKDTAAGAVLVLAIISAVIGVIIFFPKLIILICNII